MQRFHPKLPSPAMMVALAALFVALSGGAYAASKIGAADIQANAIRSSHIKAKQVKLADLGAVAKFRRETAADTPVQTVLRHAGLEIRFGCVGGRADLRARTSVANSVLEVEVLTEGTTQDWGDDQDFDTGEELGISLLRFVGQGTLTYSNPRGAVVVFDYSFLSKNTGGCSARGLAIGG